MAQLNGCHDAEAAEAVAGYYFLYQRDDRRNPFINRSLVRFTATARGSPSRRSIFCPAARRHCRPVSNIPAQVSFSTAASMSSCECRIGKSIWFGSFYLTDFARLSHMSGLSMGVEPDARGEVIALRTVMQFLGTEIDVRAMSRRCGQIPENAPEFDDLVRHYTRNDQRDGDAVFASRL